MGFVAAAFAAGLYMHIRAEHASKPATQLSKGPLFSVLGLPSCPERTELLYRFVTSGMNQHCFLSHFEK